MRCIARRKRADTSDSPRIYHRGTRTTRQAHVRGPRIPIAPSIRCAPLRVPPYDKLRATMLSTPARTPFWRCPRCCFCSGSWRAFGMHRAQQQRNGRSIRLLPGRALQQRRDSHATSTTTRLVDAVSTAPLEQQAQTIESSGCIRLSTPSLTPTVVGSSDSDRGVQVEATECHHSITRWRASGRISAACLWVPRAAAN